MKKTLYAVVLLAAVGCQKATPDASPVMSAYPTSAFNYRPQETPRLGMGASYGTRYIPEADTWIDYSEDPENWHYRGRDRDMTKEERDIYQLQRAIAADPENKSLREELRKMSLEYQPILEALSDWDKARFDHRVQQLVSERAQRRSPNP
jgi:hypothetical protein